MKPRWPGPDSLGLCVGDGLGRISVSHWCSRIREDYAPTGDPFRSKTGLEVEWDGRRRWDGESAFRGRGRVDGGYVVIGMYQK